MSGRPVRALAMASVFGAFGFAAGCGGSDEGTQVQVDKEKEEKLTKAMEQYYMKKQGPAKQPKKAPDNKAE
jgi:hypothetical protein